MNRKIWSVIACLLLYLSMAAACAAQSELNPGFLQLKQEQEIYTAPSEDAWVTGRPDAGQVVYVKEHGKGDAQYWAYVIYSDQKTGIDSEGWLRCTQNVMPYDYLLADFWSFGAQENAQQRLEAFCARVDADSAVPDFVFEEEYVGESFKAMAVGVVDGEEVYIRVELDGAYAEERFTHFVVTGRKGCYPGGGYMPVARLNATKTDMETGMSVCFEGVADYLPGTEEIVIYPVLEGQAELDQRAMVLRPEGRLAAIGAAQGDSLRMIGQPHKSLPMMTFTFTDTGKQNEDNEHLLRLLIASEDGGYQQEIVYASNETVGSLGLGRLQDVNFDGYLDLVLVHALGASNWFSVFAPWLPAEGRFAEPIADVRFCNHVLHPEQRLIVSSVRDGAVSYHDQAYGWVGSGMLFLYGESSTYDTGDRKTVGERVIKYYTDGGEWLCWDERYPMSWYSDNARVWNERRSVLAAMLIGGTRQQFAVVANVDWVNLRSRDSKTSPSLAKINAGETVEILAYGCGEDRGWIRVYYSREGEEQGYTGYIWKTYLQEIN